MSALIFGKERECWKCNYRGPFRYSVFFLLFGVLIFVCFGLSVYFDIVFYDWWIHSVTPLGGRMIGGTVVTFGGALWFLKNHKNFFLCPKCGMPENGKP